MSRDQVKDDIGRGRDVGDFFFAHRNDGGNSRCGISPYNFLLSRSYNGGVPNGESRKASISRDQRIARVAAYESDASNIVRGDDNDATDVFLVKRGRGWGQNGTPWHIGKTKLISHGMGGKAANGPSYKPAVAGSSFNVPTCVAFISEASNLVGGDTNGVADAFVYNMRNGRITRVSVSSTGQQANGPTPRSRSTPTGGRIGFVSTATNLGYSGGRQVDLEHCISQRWKHRQEPVYVHIRSGPLPEADLPCFGQQRS